MMEQTPDAVRLAPLDNVIEVKQNGKHAHFTICVEPIDVKNYMLGETGFGGLLLIDRAAYLDVEKKMLSEKLAQQPAIAVTTEQAFHEALTDIKKIAGWKSIPWSYIGDALYCFKRLV